MKRKNGEKLSAKYNYEQLLFPFPKTYFKSLLSSLLLSPLPLIQQKLIKMEQEKRMNKKKEGKKVRRGR